MFSKHRSERSPSAHRISVSGRVEFLHIFSHRYLSMHESRVCHRKWTNRVLVNVFGDPRGFCQESFWHLRNSVSEKGLVYGTSSVLVSVCSLSISPATTKAVFESAVRVQARSLCRRIRCRSGFPCTWLFPDMQQVPRH